MDHDVANPTGESVFSNIVVTGCGSLTDQRMLTPAPLPREGAGLWKAVSGRSPLGGLAEEEVGDEVRK